MYMSNKNKNIITVKSKDKATVKANANAPSVKSKDKAIVKANAKAPSVKSKDKAIVKATPSVKSKDKSIVKAKAKAKSKKPEYIGSGSYGCTFSPPVPCNGNTMIKKDKKLLGKIFYKPSEMIYELNIYKKILKIDPHSKIFPRVFPYSTCVLNEKENKINLNKCRTSKFDNNSNIKFQIFQEYAGRDLILFLNDEKLIIPEDPLFLVGKFMTFGENLYNFNKHFYHNDIHMNNIVIDDDFNIKLIDVGLVSKETIEVDSDIRTHPLESYIARKNFEQKIFFSNDKTNGILANHFLLFTKQISIFYDNTISNEFLKNAKNDITEWQKNGFNMDNANNTFDSYCVGICFLETMNYLYPKWTKTNLMNLYPMINPNPDKRIYFKDVLGKLLSTKR